MRAYICETLDTSCCLLLVLCGLRQCWAQVHTSSSFLPFWYDCSGKENKSSGQAVPTQPIQASLTKTNKQKQTHKYLLSIYYLLDTRLSTEVMGMKIQTWLLQLYGLHYYWREKSSKGQVLEMRLRNCSWLRFIYSFHIKYSYYV